MIKTHTRAKTAKKHGGTGKRGRSSIYGADWRRLREFHLKREPLCRECQAKGIIKEGEEVDHIIPHNGDMGLMMDRENLQTLCKSHHSQKTITENNGDFISATMMPSWIPKTQKTMILVCGRPASGKKEYVYKNRTESDLIIDLDKMALDQGKPLHEMSKQERNKLIRIRNEIIAKFSRGQTRHDRAFIIATAGKQEHRDFWIERGAEVKIIDTPLDVCQRRINSRNIPTELKIKLMQVAQDWE